MTMKSMNRRYADECQRRNLPVDMDPADLEMALVVSMEGLTTLINHMTVDQKAEHLQWLRRFRAVYERVEGELLVLQRLCIETLRHGYEVVGVNDGDVYHPITRETPLSEITDLAMAVDESWIVTRQRHGEQRLTFILVFGNSPEELIADHTAHDDAEAIWQAVQKRSRA